MNNAADFAIRLDAIVAMQKMGVEDTIQDALVRFVEKVVERTPISDRKTTENTAANWRFAVGAPDESYDDRRGQKESNLSALRKDIKDWRPLTSGAKGYISNSRPGIWKLEYGGYPGDGPRTIGGYSTQAPSGMVGITVEEFDGMVSDAAKGMYR